jgi:hypothetical protein
MNKKKKVTGSNSKIIIIILIMAAAILGLYMGLKTSGLAVYPLGTFDNSVSGWNENEASTEGDFLDYSIDNQVYYNGGGALKGSTIGPARNWSGEYLYTTLPITTVQQTPVYLNFYWRKGYAENPPQTSNMYAILIRPDNSQRTLWQDSTASYNSWNGQSIEISSYFNQQGTYMLRIGCDLQTTNNSSNTTSASCWYDEVSLDIQNGSGGTNAPVFYDYQESVASGETFSTSNIYDFKVSVSNSEGKVWVELGGINRSTEHIGGNNYRLRITNLSAGNYNYYYWGWSPGSNKIKNISQTRAYSVTKGTGEARAIINGIRGNYNVNNNTIVCLSAQAEEGADGQRQLYVNQQIYGNQSANFQNCTKFSQPQTLNITVKWDGGTNYYPDSESWTLRILKESEIAQVNETIIRVTSPQNTTYDTGKNLELSAEANNELRECSYSIDGGEAQGLIRMNATQYKKYANVTSGSHEIFFLCKDIYGNTKSSEVITFSIKKEVTKQNDTLIVQEEQEGCLAVWKCADWGECRATSYDASEILKGRIELRGERARVCYDALKCKDAKVEREECDLTLPIEARVAEWCGKSYIEVYDTNNDKLVSRIKKEDVGQRKRVDVGFVLEEFGDYCDYCYNEIKDQDEAGIDCGGNNCQECTKPEEKTISGNLLRIMLITIEIIVIGGILSYLFYWLILAKLWKAEEKTADEDPALAMIKKALMEGYSSEQIREILKKKGWTDKQIEGLISRAEN